MIMVTIADAALMERDVEVLGIKDREEDEMVKTELVPYLMETGETTRSNPSKSPRKCMISRAKEA